MPYLMWLNEEMAPNDSAAAESPARKARRYTVINGELYRKGANNMIMKCVPRSEGLQLL